MQTESLKLRASKTYLLAGFYISVAATLLILFIVSSTEWETISIIFVVLGTLLSLIFGFSLRADGYLLLDTEGMTIKYTNFLSKTKHFQWSDITNFRIARQLIGRGFSVKTVGFDFSDAYIKTLSDFSANTAKWSKDHLIPNGYIGIYENYGMQPEKLVELLKSWQLKSGVE